MSIACFVNKYSKCMGNRGYLQDILSSASAQGRFEGDIMLYACFKKIVDFNQDENNL